MNYFSICSGIECASVAWHPLGFEPLGFCEIEPFRSAVLNYHYPEVKNYGDFTKIGKKDIGGKTPTILVGGTPCATFSVAGLREGIKSDRGNLALSLFSLLKDLTPSGLFGKTSPVSCHLTEEKTLLPSSGGWQVSGMGSPTGFLTLNTYEHNGFQGQSPKCEGVSSLSDILETGDVPQRYYLTEKSCLGILRRAERKKKKLPEKLYTAVLEAINMLKTTSQER